MAEPDTHKPSLFYRARRFFFHLGIVYAILIALLATPFVQRHAAYQHSLRFPLFANFSLPEKYGLAPGKTLNFHLTTADNETLGAWFVLSDPIYHSLSSEPLSSLSEATVTHALTHAPTILFLHGAAGTRAVAWRVSTYSSFTSRLACNILALDYRGFADSTGVPSEDGLVEDAYTGWRWLLEHGAKPEDVLIMGHSLGTGVAGQFVSLLAKEYKEAGEAGVKPRGVVLNAPFSSLTTLVETYSIFHIPVLQPLQSFPLGVKLLKHLLYHEFNTLAAVSHFHVPTLIAHSHGDTEILHSHSVTLIDALLAPLLPPAPSLPAPGSPFIKEEFAAFTQAQNERRAARSAVVSKREVPGFGVVEEFDRDGQDGKGERKVVYVESFWGTHAKIGLQEGVQDEIARMFKLGPYAS